MMNTVVFSVIYPQAEQYFLTFLESLSNQTDKNFELFLLNDGCGDIDRYLHKVDISVKVKSITGLPASLRKQGIAWVKREKFDMIIFADSDDYFAEDRVELAKSTLDENDIMVNELVLFGKNIPIPVSLLSQHYKNLDFLSANHLKHCNCMGLSNTAIRINKITPFIAKIPDSIVSFDWALFALCLHEGAKAIINTKTTTYYRQYGYNIASPFMIEDEQIMRGVFVKRNHYRLLAQFYNEYDQLADLYGCLSDKLQSCGSLREQYFDAVKKNSSPFPLWWEPIKSLRELGL